MAVIESSIRVLLSRRNDPTWCPVRKGEPITVGVPLPPGAVRSPTELRLETEAGFSAPLQARALDRWADGSLRWVLLDFQADAGPGTATEYFLRSGGAGSAAPLPQALVVTEDAGAIRVATGSATFEFSRGSRFPFSSILVGASQPIDATTSGLTIADEKDVADFFISAVRLHDSGPLRAEIEVHGVARAAGALAALDVYATVEFFAGMATARIAVTIRNQRRARHAGGHWVLGDPGSVLVRFASLKVELSAPVDRVRVGRDVGANLEDAAIPVEIYQESSGGDHWNGPVHRNRQDEVPLRFRGYRFRTAGVERTGLRAQPIVVAHAGASQVAVAVPQFWENFPRAIAVDARRVELDLFPRQSPDLHELQGGEQKTHVLALAFGRDPVTDLPLAWCHDPQLWSADPAWSCATGAIPFLVTAAEDARPDYLALAAGALDPAQGFVQKREVADEYGWRHFGDLPADHESAYQPPGQPFVSHYNNQYDAIAGFALHFLRTGDPTWWRLMSDLARHVRDIDIYHTTEDKAAYNGGLFWHTRHYADAGTSTHRTYPRGGGGGGPSSEHNYNAGLMLHYFLTGERASRTAAIGLGGWVRNMDDGGLTVFRTFAGGATGLASATGSVDYHGPGRGAGHSILACLVAHQLSADPVYLLKAEELVRRCVHPNDDISARQLDNPEQRWSYTAFLQALGGYLQGKTERGEFDERFEYARSSLLHYARWMALHERPYLEKPDLLEYPTETWAAQDLRKADVFLWAALHVEGAERQTFMDRARFFHDYAVGTLAAMPTRSFTRPLVLVLVHGLRYGWFQRHGGALPAPAPVPALAQPQSPLTFEPQKARALRRAKSALLVAVAAVALLAAVLVAW